MTAPSAAAAIANADSYTSYESGMCLKWVRGPCWEIGSLYGSAIEAWNGAKYKHPGDRNPPDGAALFYRGGNYGHVVIRKPGDMRSTDCPSSGRVGDAEIAWVEDNWGYEYLGWTEDLNGVRLPLDSEPDPEPAPPPADNQEDDMFIFKCFNPKYGNGFGQGAHYLVFGGQAVQCSPDYVYEDAPVILSSSEDMNAAFFSAVKRHSL